MKTFLSNFSRLIVVLVTQLFHRSLSWRLPSSQVRVTHSTCFRSPPTVIKPEHVLRSIHLGQSLSLRASSTSSIGQSIKLQYSSQGDTTTSNLKSSIDIDVDKVHLHEPTSSNDDGWLADLSDQEKELLTMLLPRKSLPLMQYPVDKGILMTSAYASETSSSLDQPLDKPIRGVPMDTRDASRRQLLKSLSKPKGDHGVDLLCTCGYKGSGNTVQQGMNLKWFVNETHGIGIEISYNDDQGYVNLSNGEDQVRNDHEFAQSVALRILHRVMEYMFDEEMAWSCLSSIPPILEAVAELSDPIVSALKIVKKIVGAPAGTKIMLTVDEIVLASDASIYPTEWAVSLLCHKYLDKYPWFYLSVSVYDAESLAEFATDSSRNLLFQNLPPIEVTLGLDASKIPLLPIMLQPFYDEQMRKLLPFEPQHLDLYSTISHWLIQTGGHPSSLQTLFKAMRKFDGLYDNKSFPWITTRDEGVEFMEKLLHWLDSADHEEYGKLREWCIESSITSDGRIPRYESWVSRPSRSPVEALAALAVDTVRPFKLGSKDHSVTLEGINSGICSVLEQDGNFQAFVPSQVLSIVADQDGFTTYDPCGEALCQLTRGITHLQTSLDMVQDAKYCGKVMSNAVLLFSRANDEFSPKVFCLGTYTGEAFDDLTLKLDGGKKVQYKKIQTFPPAGVLTVEQIGQFVRDNLPSDGVGTIVVPENKDNLVDYFAIFRSSRYRSRIIVLTFQSKLWFDDLTKNDGHTQKYEDIISSWKQHNTKFPIGPIKVKDVDGKDMTIECLHILQTANDIEKIVKNFKCAENEGIGTIAQMRSWNPTASFAIENAMHMRKLFRNYPME